MNETTHDLPDEISFTESDVARMSVRRTLNEGWYRFIITDAKKKEAASGNLMLAVECAPLKDPEDANSKGTPTLRHNVILPFPNPNIEDHVAPDTGGIVRSFVLAIEGVAGVIPRYDKETKTFLINGDPVEKEVAATRNKEIDRAAMVAVQGYWKEPMQLNDCVFYAQVYQNGEFTNLKRLSNVLPDDAELVDPKNFSGKASDTSITGKRK